MKKMILVLVAMMAVGLVAYGNPYTIADYEYSASGVNDATANYTAYTNRAIRIYSIAADSDSATSKITIAKGNTTGVTNNYTTIGTIPCGTSFVTLKGDANSPLFVGAKNYQYRFTVNGVSLNSIVITGEYK